MSLATAAFDQALNMLGQPSKHALLFHLKERYGISVDGDVPFTFQQLRLALEKILGAATVDIILESVFVKMDELAM
jgi:hypothetical protein